MKRVFLSSWQIWGLIALVAVFAIDVASHLTNFPVRLGMLRVGVLLAEQVWTKFRI